ncbi:hypothetical protein ZIOFF_043319 [Zingiber officinale]|uniref:MADS-box domain-containing protein n=1 Tax=Zingiber officinale TaxID=94328 RepID=A0A8J5G062_ZINOF|nr:hypothetical protein ZIOFF_043319 [Zingiber officinale]
MSRKKAKLVRIANDSTRRATFKKRKNGLLKKVSEFATLCNVSTCMIIYNPEEAAMQPEAWPSPPEAARIVVQFRNIPLVEQRQKMLSQESFLSQRIAKLEDQLRRAERKNRELSVSLLVNEALASGKLPVVGIDDAAAVARAADSMLKEVREQINKEAAWQALSSATAPVVDPLDIAMESVQASKWLDSNCAFDKELIMPMPYTNHVGDAWIKVEADSKLKEERERIYKEAALQALSSATAPVVEPLDIGMESVQASTWLDNNGAFGKELIMPMLYTNHVGDAWIKVQADSKLKEVREWINKEAALQALSSVTAPVVEPLDIAKESVQASTWLDSNCAFDKELIMPMPYTNHVGDAWTQVQVDSKLKELRERIYKEAARRALSSATAPVVEPLDIESVQASTWLDSNCALGKELIMPTPSINAQQLVPLSYDIDHGNMANWQMENIDAIGGEDIFPVTFAHHANNSWLDGNYGINGEQVLQMPYAGENGNITEEQMQIVPYADRVPTHGSILTFP